jgi:hypothetical protein
LTSNQGDVIALVVASLGSVIAAFDAPRLTTPLKSLT